VITILSLPISLPGALFHAPIGLLAKFIGSKLAQNYEDQQAHYKVMVSMLLVPIVYLITFIALSILWGPMKAIICILLLVFSVYIAIIVRPLTFSLKFLGTVTRLLTFNRQMLKKEHDSLFERLQKLIGNRAETQPLRALVRPQSFQRKKQH
jgi:hypothetical protein